MDPKFRFLRTAILLIAFSAAHAQEQGGLPGQVNGRWIWLAVKRSQLFQLSAITPASEASATAKLTWLNVDPRCSIQNELIEMQTTKTSISFTATTKCDLRFTATLIRDGDEWKGRVSVMGAANAVVELQASTCEACPPLATGDTTLVGVTAGNPNACGGITVRQLLESGGVQLQGEDLRRVLIDSAWQIHAYPETITFNTNGNFSGFEQPFIPESWARGVHGTWLIENNERLCMTYVYLRSPGTAWCQRWFRQGDRYFSGSLDSPLLRAFKK